MKESFVFYRNFYDAIKGLPIDIQVEIYTAIVEYSLNGNEIDNLNPITKSLFALMKPQIEMNNQRYENGKKGAEYGILGGRPKKQNPKETPRKPQENPKETPRKPQTETKTPQLIISKPGDYKIDSATPPLLESPETKLKESTKEKIYNNNNNIYNNNILENIDNIDNNILNNINNNSNSIYSRWQQKNEETPKNSGSYRYTLSSFEERKNGFANEIAKYKDIYSSEMLHNFYDYWTQCNSGSYKMLWEKERDKKSFAITNRLATWNRNSNNRKTNNYGNTSTNRKPFDEETVSAVVRAGIAMHEAEMQRLGTA